MERYQMSPFTIYPHSSWELHDYIAPLSINAPAVVVCPEWAMYILHVLRSYLLFFGRFCKEHTKVNYARKVSSGTSAGGSSAHVEHSIHKNSSCGHKNSSCGHGSWALNTGRITALDLWFSTFTVRRYPIYRVHHHISRSTCRGL